MKLNVLLTTVLAALGTLLPFLRRRQDPFVKRVRQLRGKLRRIEKNYRMRYDAQGNLTWSEQYEALLRIEYKITELSRRTCKK